MLDCETLAFIEEVATVKAEGIGKPVFQFGRSSTVNVLTWLDNNSIPSNKTGLPFGLENGFLRQIWVGNELLVGYDVTLYYHLGDEVGLTVLTTVTITGAFRTQTFSFNDFGLVGVPKEVQIAARVTAVPGGNPRNVSVHATILGTN